MDKDFLLGVLAVQLGFVTPAEVMAAASAWLADRTKGIAQRLRESGALEAGRVELLQTFVADALKQHEGDVQRTLHSLGGEPALLRSFGGSVVCDESGGMRVEAAADSEEGGEPSEDGDRDADSRTGESVLVSMEQPGRYHLRGGSTDEAEIGRGGLGRVLLAHDAHLGREVAIKELLGNSAGSQSTSPRGSGSRSSALVSRFLREARVTGQLEHPNIVPVYEVGQRADGTFFYSMRVVRGSTLGDKLKACRNLDERLALLPHYVDLCNAIAYAHSRGVVHRDVKPHNVMIGEFGETVVLDWGLAKVRGKKDIRGKEIARELKLLQEAGAGHTVDGSAIGTPAYMSPEQADGRVEDIDERSDVWGLGAVLYELLTGKPPFEGVTPFEILGKVMKDRVAPVRSRAAEAPAELAAVAEKALQREPAERYNSAKGLADEVEGYLHGARVSAYSYSSWELVKRFVARNRALSLGIVAVLVTMVVSSAVILMAYDREQEARAHAEQKEREAVTQQRQARLNLARSYVRRAVELVSHHSYGEAFLYAAAARREASLAEEPLPTSQRVALDSALYEASLRRTLSLERTLTSPERQPYAMDFSSNGKLLAVSNLEGEISVQPLDGDGPGITRKLGSVVYMLRFSADDEVLMAGCADGTLRSLDPADLSEKRVENLAPGKTATGWALSPDHDRVLLVDGEFAVSLVHRSGEGKVVPLGKGWVSPSPDGERVLRMSMAGDLVLHDGQSGEELASFEGAKEFGYVVISPDGKRAALLTRLGLDVVDLQRQSVVARLESHGVSVKQFAFTPDGRALWIAGDDGLYAWDTRGAERGEMLWEGSAVTRLAFSRDGSRVATASAGAVRVWRIRAREVVSAPTDGNPTNASFSADRKRVAIGDMDGGVYLWTLGPGGSLAKLGKMGTLVPDVALAPDGRHVAAVDNDFHLTLYRATDGAAIKSVVLGGMKPASAMFPALEYSSDGKWLAVSGPDGRLQLLDSKSLELERFVQGRMRFDIMSLRFSPDGRYLCAGDRMGWLSCFAVDGWRPVREIRTDHKGYLMDIAFSPDGKTVFTAGQDGWLKHFSLDTGELLKAWQAHETFGNRASLSPDGGLLFTGADDLKARLWDPSTGALLYDFRRPGQVVVTTFTPDGKSLVLGGIHGIELLPDPRTVMLPDPEALLSEALRTTGYRLDDGQDAAGTTSAPATAAPRAAAAGPNEVRGRLLIQNTLAGDAIPEGTTLELLHHETEKPLSPPLRVTVPPDGRVSFLLPEGVDQFAARTTLSGAVTVEHSSSFARGTDFAAFTHVPPEIVRFEAAIVGVEPAKDRGTLAGRVTWGRRGQYASSAPQGCAEVTTSSGARVYYMNPEGAVDPRMTLNHPKNDRFHIYDVEPGEHRLTARIGEHRVETTARVRAGEVTMVDLLFDAERFPESPMPPRCYAEGSPEDVAWRGEPAGAQR